MMPKSIPEDLQSGMRRRLELLRRSKHLNKTQVRSVSMGTLIRYEQQDISSAKMGDMVSLAAEYGLTPQEFFDYLFGQEELVNIVHKEHANVTSATIYLRQLSEDQQQLAIMLLRSLVEYQELATSGALTVVPQSAYRTPRKVGDTRALLEQAIEDARQGSHGSVQT